jgi:ubiquinone biosynthesis protein
MAAHMDKRRSSFEFYRRLSARLLQVLWTCCQFALLWWVLDPIRVRLGKRASLDRANRLKQFFETIGGSYIKMGQIMALQPDLIPREYCDALFDLMDRVRSVPPEISRELFRQKTGKSVDQVFDDFEDKPLATASIGQVHRARLKGVDVVVKVQRPEAVDEMIPDIEIAGMAVKLIERFNFQPLMFMVEPLTEFIHWTWEELDYRYEARYTEKALELSKGDEMQKVPEVFSQWTTSRTVVFEFLEGITVLDVIRQREKEGGIPAGVLPAGYNSKVFCDRIVRIFLESAFTHGFFHADLHPANLIIMEDNVVGYIDFGITGLLSEYSRRNLMRLTLAYAKGDMDEMAEVFLTVSTLNSRSDFGKLKAILHEKSKSWYGPENNASVSAMMLDWIYVSRDANIWPQRDVVKYIRCSVAMDGLIKRLDPSFDVSSALASATTDHLTRDYQRVYLSFDKYFRSASSLAELIAIDPARIRKGL